MLSERLLGHSAERKGTPELASGSWFVENVREELDAAGEWFYNESTRQLYLWPNGTQVGGAAPSPDKTLIVPQLTTLVRIDGGARDVAIRDVGFRDAAPSFLEHRWGVPSGGDWALYAGGAVVLNQVTASDSFCFLLVPSRILPNPPESS